MIVLWVTGLIFLIDQVTKYLIRTEMTLYESVPVIQNFFHLTYVTNDGMAFGINFPYGIYFFTLVSIILTCFLFYFLWKEKDGSLMLRLSLALILAGALGNLIDRVLFGKVVDFLDFMIGSYHWYIFNVADSSVSVGMTVFIVYNIFFLEKPQKILHIE